MVGCSLDFSNTKSSALQSWMCVNLLCRTLSIRLIPVTWHKLRSVIWAHSRHCSSRDSLLLKKGQPVICADAPPFRGWILSMTSWSLPQHSYSCVLMYQTLTPTPMFPKWKLTFSKKILHSTGWKRDKVTIWATPLVSWAPENIFS